ncbi:hypothetical protein N7462_007082 [Penicillium macrosclerotiorum]|uniref:uncharacterized protein n=1 Tax=Penicillium macrosclerotiorum TaxID=303699 RepID=UPI0025468ED0|nr:uncharacterized protein N7462_007082 [Penicillium macrosclerotiorum]KAJ5678838.1 hypothetical protein N7462_007082 [Penicillium macrosclerotiorum]
MRPQPKPDSSFASNRLTRTNRPKRHLLSTFNRPQSEIDTETKTEPKRETSGPVLNAVILSDDDDDELLSSHHSSEFEDGLESDNLPGRDANEPATDAEPLSSTDDDMSDSDSGPSKSIERIQSRSLGEKLAGGDTHISSPSPWSGGVTRTLSSFIDDDDGDEIFPSWSSSQSVKRLKKNTYRSSTSLSRVPSYSARSTLTPEKRSQKTKSGPPKSKRNPSDSESEAETSFKVPMDIDAPTSKTTLPAKITQNASAGFKVPRTFPHGSTSSSSLGTLSSKELQAAVDADNSPLSPLSSLPSSPSVEPGEPRKALCPMCKLEVDPELLMRFEAQPRRRVRDQQQFCASHQQDTAEKEWEAQGYPDIDWDTFDERVQKYFPILEKHLVPDCSSYYRNILDTSLKSGKAQNFRLTLAGDGLEMISCGYYGTKGAGKMLQAVTDRFSLRLRRLATSDHIVKTAGVVGYAQSVLVPELAVCLVKEDMGVSEETARQILRESISLGEKLHPAVDDVVPIPDNVDETLPEE